MSRLLPYLALGLVFGYLWPVTRIPWGDGPFLMSQAWMLAAPLRDGHLLDALRAWLGTATPHPPLAVLPVMFGQLLLGDPVNGARLGITLMAMLGAHALEKLGGGWIGWVACPLVWLGIEQAGVDVTTTAVVLQAIAALQAGQGGRAGLWIAAALGTRYAAPLFVWLPLLVVLVRQPRLALTAGGLGIGLALPWYLAHTDAIGAYIGSSLTADVSAITWNGRSWAERLSPTGLLYYPLSIKDALGWPGLILVGLGWWAGRRTLPRLPMLAALGGLVGLSLLGAAQDRYALPAMGALLVGLGGLRHVPLLPLAVFGMLFVGNLRMFAPSASASAAPSFAHPPDTALRPAWPVATAYGPSAIDVDAWQLPTLLTAVKDADIIGLLLPFDFHLPDVGVLQLVAVREGVTPNLYPIRPAPMQPASGAFPADIQVVLAFDETNIADPARRAWLTHQGFTLRQALRLPGDRAGSIWVRGTAQP